MHSLSFPGSFRLKSRRLIGQVFQEGSSGFRFPIKYLYQYIDEPGCREPVQIAFSVSKKKIPKAVNRNRVKRLMREAFRLHWRSELGDVVKNVTEGKKLAIVLIYISDEIQEFSRVEDSIKRILQQIGRGWEERIKTDRGGKK